MGSPPRTPREEEQRLNMRTLVIASAASATAALVTSRLWIAGTWIAAALTPVMVTLISEMLRRPTERIARGITVDRAALPDPEAPAAARPEAAAAQRVAERLRGVDELLPDPEAPPPQGPSRAGPGAPPAPTRVYRSESAGRAPRRRKIAYRVVLATAGIAFLIGAFTLTLGELVGGGSVGDNGRRTTLIGGGSSNKQDPTQDRQIFKRTETDQTDQTETERQPTTTEEEPTTSETTTTPTTPEQPPAEPLPGETTTTTPAQP